MAMDLGLDPTGGRFLKKYPITSYFVLAILLGAGIITLVFQGIIPDQLALSSALSASIAGILMTAILDGKGGLKLLFRRILIWRVGIGNWLFALFYIIPAIYLGALANPLFNGDPFSSHNLRLPQNLLPMFMVFFIAAGLGQELGWAGFLLPRLQAKYSALKSSLIRAVLVLLWHGPLLVYTYFHPRGIAYFPYGEWMIQNGVLFTLLAMAALSLPWSIFTTWIFNNTGGSLLLASVLHGSEFWLAILLTGLRINTNNLNNYWGYGMVMLLAAVAIVILSGPLNLSRKHERIRHQ
jgi:membrane protease YdiL (CAAX protease family)